MEDIFFAVFSALLDALLLRAQVFQYPISWLATDSIIKSEGGLWFSNSFVLIMGRGEIMVETRCFLKWHS